MANTKKKGEKRLPQRTCVACREIESKKTLIRIVRAPDGVVADPTGKLPGRGAYLHDSRECWEKAIQRGILARSLKTELTAADVAYLQTQIEERFGESLPN